MDSFDMSHYRVGDSYNPYNKRLQNKRVRVIWGIGIHSKIGSLSPLTCLSCKSHNIQIRTLGLCLDSLFIGKAIMTKMDVLISAWYRRMNYKFCPRKLLILSKTFPVSNAIMTILPRDHVACFWDVVGTPLHLKMSIRHKIGIYDEKILITAGPQPV